jgi:hypothetical protein
MQAVKAYKSGVLHKEHHERLVANLEGFARDAGIAPHYIWTKLADTCGPDEVDYVVKFNQHRAGVSTQGLVLTRGGPAPDPVNHMSAIAGALVRNFVRARVMTLNVVLDALQAGNEPEATALLIPNFFIAKSEWAGGSTVPLWRVGHLYDLLVRRATRGQQTIVYATSVPALAEEYGPAMGQLIDSRYLQTEI